MLPKKLPWELAQTQWPQQLDPLLSNPLNSASILKNQSLGTGTTTINHRLGAPLQGWYIIRQRAGATIYDLQDTNPTPQLTLVLHSSAPVVVDIAVI